MSVSDKGLSVVIIGGGISGLATAYYLQKYARDRALPLSLHLVERARRLGGVISTVRQDGFIVEGGPDSMLSYKPAGIHLLQELGLTAEVVGTSPENRGSFVYSRGALHPLPEGLTLMIPGRLGPLFRTRLISWPGKLRAGLDLFRTQRHGDGDLSVAEFVEHHLGREVFERIVEPLFAGIYAGDARVLSLPATYPQLLALEHDYGSLLRGLLLMRHRGRSGNGHHRAHSSRWTAFITLRAGLLRLVEVLESHLENVRVHRGVNVTWLARQQEKNGSGLARWRIGLEGGPSLAADAVVMAVPAYAAAELLVPLDKNLADALSDIPYVSSATVSLAFRRDDISHPLKGYGFVVPRVERRPLLACTWTSSKFPHRAPPGYVLFRAFLGRSGQEEVVHRSEDALVALTLSELRTTMGVNARPTHAWVFRWRPGLPQYTVGHNRRLARIDERLTRLPGLYLAGNAYRGVGIPDCIATGERVAREIVGSVAPDV